MKYLNCILVFVISISILNAQDLGDKKKQLEDLKEEIEKQEEVIKEKDAEKQETIGDLNKAKKKKSEIESEIKQLQSSELKAKQKLNETIHRIDETRSNITNLDLLCEEEFTKLFIAHYTEDPSPEHEINKEYLASLLKFTIKELGSVQQTKNFLEIEKKDKNTLYNNVISNKNNTKKKKKEYESRITGFQDDISKLDQEKKELEAEKNRLEEEASALDELIAKLQSELTNDYFTFEFSVPELNWPVKGEVIKEFGEQKSEEYKVSLFNNGIDIAVEEGTPVHAVDNGIVAYAEWYSGAGKLVILNHQNGFYSLYSHNSTLLVSKGDHVSRDQKIALSGKTGSAESALLHFEIRKRGTPVNPLEYLKK